MNTLSSSILSNSKITANTSYMIPGILNRIPSKSPLKTNKIAGARISNPAKDKLDIPLNQKISFGLTVAAIAANLYSYAGGSPFPAQGLGLMTQAAASFSLVSNFYNAPIEKSILTLASIGLTFTPLNPLVQGMFTYNMVKETSQLAQKTLGLRDGNNNMKVARNLLVYGTNALHSSYYLLKSVQNTFPNSKAPSSTSKSPSQDVPNLPSESPSQDVPSLASSTKTTRSIVQDTSPLPYGVQEEPITTLEEARMPFESMLRVIKESSSTESSIGKDPILAALRDQLSNPAKKAVQRSGGQILLSGSDIKKELDTSIPKLASSLAKRISELVAVVQKINPKYKDYKFSEKESESIAQELFLNPALNVLDGKSDMDYVKKIYQDTSSTFISKFLSGLGN